MVLGGCSGSIDDADVRDDHGRRIDGDELLHVVGKVRLGKCGNAYED
jgi:hypothetical protein